MSELSEDDLIALGFDTKCEDISESSVDSWNRHWYVDRIGNRIYVDGPYWYEYPFDKGTYLKISLKGSATWVKGHYKNKEELELILNKSVPQKIRDRRR